MGNEVAKAIAPAMANPMAMAIATPIARPHGEGYGPPLHSTPLRGYVCLKRSVETNCQTLTSYRARPRRLGIGEPKP
jgi:hypothetical protein